MMKRIFYTISTILFFTILMAGFAILQKNFGYAAKKSEIYFSQNIKKLEVGNAFTFKVFGVNNDSKAVLWHSSNPEIAKISKCGKVVARKRGTTMITARVMKGRKKISQKLTVTDHKRYKKNMLRKKDFKKKTVKNLSKQVKKIENLGWDDIGFLDWKELDTFCYSMFQKTISSKEENPVISPLSAYLALALVADGAKGNTKTQFDSVLGKNMLSTRIHQLTESFAKISGNTKLSIADSIWLDDLFTANDSWLSNMVNYYDAEIFQTDLSTDIARQKINQWVSKKTKKLIPSMFKENLEEDVALLLMNTIYLKAKWMDQFDSALTNHRTFINENGKETKTKFMNQYKSYCSYFKSKDAEGVILPYDDERLSMIAILPKGDITARELAKKLTGKKISSYIKNAEATYSNLHLPKFTMQYSKKMNDILIEMGLEDAFSPSKANFTGISTTKNGDNSLYISEVLQKVKIKVKEDGTQAAAATNISMKTTGAIPTEEAKEITFDKPFLYLIVDTKTPFGENDLNEEGDFNIPLFMGMVTELK